MPDPFGIEGVFLFWLKPFVGYLIAHDGHHGGHAILTLKLCGI